MNSSNPLPENEVSASTMVCTDPSLTTADSKIDSQKALNVPVNNSIPQPPPSSQKNRFKQLITPHRIVLAVLSICLVTSFAVNFYQHAKIKVTEAAAVQTAKLLITVQDNLTSAEKDRDNYLNKYNEQLNTIGRMSSQYEETQRYISWYYERIALINNYYGNCAYHRIGCPRLDDKFYVFTVKEAHNKDCYACPYCQ